MKNTKLEGKIKQAFSNSVPNILDSVLTNAKEQKGTVIIMKETKKSNIWLKRIASVAAVFVVLIFGMVGMNIYNTNYSIASTVSLDVNPSIEIKVNNKEQVLEVNALNDEAETVIDNMDFKGNDLDVTVNALIGSMLRHGYISEISNSILVSVANDDSEKGAIMKKKLTDEISKLLQTDTFSGAVLSQTLLKDDELKALADKYGISCGKVQLIQKIIDQNSLYKFEDLVSLSINELNLLRASDNTDSEIIESVGTASDKDYIGTEKAKEVAFKHAGISAKSAQMLEVKLDYEDGIMIYEVEFNVDGYEYEYEIDAKTGKVISYEKDDDDIIGINGENNNVPKNNNQDSKAGFIGEDKAKSKAFSHAGVKAENVTKCKVELDKDDAIYIYEVDFEAGNYEYDYGINAQTGEVIKHEKEVNDDITTNKANSDNSSSGKTSSGVNSNNDKKLISKSKAKTKALSHAGVKSANVKGYTVKLDRDDGINIYEIDFKAGDYEYDYEINAITGAIIKHEKEIDDDMTSNKGNSSNIPSTSFIGGDKAKSKAFSHAGVKAANVKNCTVELDEDDGVYVYAVEFKANNYEYDYEIKAETGTIIKSERETDD